MATYYKDGYTSLPAPFNAPYGNLSVLPFKFETDASGIMADSNKATAVAATDIIVLGVLPKGSKLIDAIACVSNTFTDTSTFDLGFQYVDGDDSTAVPEDADYFYDAGDFHDAVGILRKATGTAPVVLPKDAYLILTNNTAAQAEAGAMDISIIVEQQG